MNSLPLSTWIRFGRPRIGYAESIDRKDNAVAAQSGYSNGTKSSTMSNQNSDNHLTKLSTHKKRGSPLAVPT